MSTAVRGVVRLEQANILPGLIQSDCDRLSGVRVCGFCPLPWEYHFGRCANLPDQRPHIRENNIKHPAPGAGPGDPSGENAGAGLYYFLNVPHLPGVDLQPPCRLKRQ